MNKGGERPIEDVPTGARGFPGHGDEVRGSVRLSSSRRRYPVYNGENPTGARGFPGRGSEEGKHTTLADLMGLDPIPDQPQTPVRKSN